MSSTSQVSSTKVVALTRKRKAYLIGAYIYEEAGLCDSANRDENSDHCTDVDLFGAIGV